MMVHLTTIVLLISSLGAASIRFWAVNFVMLGTFSLLARHIYCPANRER